jgi:hypothetical protein
MASLDSLPADQRAVLQLILQRGRSYDDIAQLLSIDRAAVRERALAGLDALGPQTRVPPERRALITDYLLGQLPPRVSDELRDRLAQSASERAWARVLAAELAPLAAEGLPEIPAEAPGSREPVAAAVAPPAAADAPDDEPAPRIPPDHGVPDRPPDGAPRSSRVGGAVLLAAGALIAIIVVLVIVLTNNGSSSRTSSASASTPSASSTPASTPTISTTPKVVSQINLISPTKGKAAGIADVLRQGTSTGIAIVASGLQANTKHDAYAVWLYNSATDSHILGFVNPGVGANGKLSTAGALPANAVHYKNLIVTLETQASPKAPGTIVLEGALTGL